MDSGTLTVAANSIVNTTLQGGSIADIKQPYSVDLDFVITDNSSNIAGGNAYVMAISSGTLAITNGTVNGLTITGGSAEGVKAEGGNVSFAKTDIGTLSITDSKINTVTLTAGNVKGKGVGGAALFADIANGTVNIVNNSNEYTSVLFNVCYASVILVFLFLFILLSLHVLIICCKCCSHNAIHYFIT